MSVTCSRSFSPIAGRRAISRWMLESTGAMEDGILTASPRQVRRRWRLSPLQLPEVRRYHDRRPKGATMFYILGLSTFVAAAAPAPAEPFLLRDIDPQSAVLGSVRELGGRVLFRGWQRSTGW